MVEALSGEPLQFQVLIQLAILSGCRRGELVGLTFSDFDKRTHKMVVERSAYKTKGKKTDTKAPKDYEIRQITIPDECFILLDLLKAEKIKEAARLGSYWNNSDWLFTTDNGEIMMFRHPQNGLLNSWNDIIFSIRNSIARHHQHVAIIRLQV
jgi:integrase